MFSYRCLTKIGHQGAQSNVINSPGRRAPLLLRSRLATALIPLVICAAVFTMSASATSVYAKCDPGRTNDGKDYADGYYNAPGAVVGGVYSSILNYSPWVYADPGGVDSSSGWSMVVKTDLSDWAQVGWIEFPYGNRNTFVEYTISGSPTDSYFPAQTTGNINTYTTLYSPPPDADFTFQVAGSTIKTVSAAWTPYEGQIAAEVHTLASQMAGGSASGNNETFSDSNIYDGGTWNTFSGSPANIDSHFGYTKASPTYYGVWDKSCTS